MDLELGHPGGQGPTTRKLSQFPPVLDLCFGAFGETSGGVKGLLDMLVDTRVRKLGLTKGTAEMGKEIALTKRYLRRRLSLATIKANVSCLLERLVQVKEGGGQGANSYQRSLATDGSRLGHSWSESLSR